MDPIDLRTEIDRALRRCRGARAAHARTRVMKAVGGRPRRSSGMASLALAGVAFPAASCQPVAPGCGLVGRPRVAVDRSQLAARAMVVARLVSSLQAAAIAAGIIWRAFLAPIAGPASAS